RFWKNGQQVNHLREEFPSSEPIRPAFRAAFEAYRDAMLPRLDLQRPLLAASSPGPPPTPRLPSPLAP
ncbi:MAG: peptidase M23, partial [Bacteroidetes bacterium]